MRHAVIALLLVSGSALAELTATDPAGFVLEHQAVVSAPPEDVWAALVDVARWWHSDHTWSGDAGNLSIDPVAQGCFCERWDGGSVTHLTVAYAMPPRTLRMVGGLGPLQAEAVNGSMTWKIDAVDGGSQIKLTYAVAGYRPGGMAGWAEPVDQVNGLQFQRLVRLLETGSPAADPDTP